MSDKPRTPQEWAWDYIRFRLENIKGLLGLSENLPKVTTFADLKEGELFIRFPWIVIENDKLAFINTELYRKILTVQRMHGPGGYYNAMKVSTSSMHEIPDNEPVLVVK